MRRAFFVGPQRYSEFGGESLILAVNERRGSVPKLLRRDVPQNLIQYGSQAQARQRHPLVHDFDLLEIVPRHALGPADVPDHRRHGRV